MTTSLQTDMKPQCTLTYEDPLTYLPHKPIQDFTRGSQIYSTENSADRLYLVIQGRVKISTTADEGYQSIGRIVRAEGLFGESALIGTALRAESAYALDGVTLMGWSRDDIEAQIEREPKLGIALSQYMVRQCIELQERIESMAAYKTPERVMLALLQLAADLGTPSDDGSHRIASLTHHTIAEFVGTSREIITSHMNRLRRAGLLRYDRKHIDILVDAMREDLRQQGINSPQVTYPTERYAAGYSR